MEDIARDTDFIFIWKIENFSMLSQKLGEKLKSPSFAVEGLYNTEWFIYFIPKSATDADYYSVFLRRSDKDGGPDVISITYKLSILPADDSPEGMISKNAGSAEYKRGSDWGFKKFGMMNHVLKKSDLYLPNDTLSLLCEMWQDSPEKKTLKRCVARTRINVERISHLWPIEKFSLLTSGTENGVNVEVCEKVSLTLHWRTDTEEGEGGAAVENVYVHVVRAKQEKPTLISADISIVDNEGKHRSVIKGKKFFESVTDDEELCLLISKRKPLIEDKDTYTRNDVLILLCELNVSDGVERSALEECSYMSPPFQNPMPDNCKLVDYLRSAYEKQQFTDVKLRAGGKEFPAHSVVLCTRSEVFSQMLKTRKSGTKKESNSKEEEFENANKVEEVEPHQDTADKSDVNNKDDDSTIKTINESQEKDSAFTKDQDNEKTSVISDFQAENSNTDKREKDSTTDGNQSTQKDYNSHDNSNINGNQDNQIDSTIDDNGSKDTAKEDNASKDDQKVNESVTKSKNEGEEKDLESTIESDQNSVKDSTKNNSNFKGDNSNVDFNEDKLVQADVTLEGLPKQDGMDVLDLDDNAETLKQLLDFLYTDEFVWQGIPSAKDLYCAAVKYKVAPLVTKCLACLRTYLTVDNVCELLEFADLHHVEKLKSYIQSFISFHMADILLSKKWQRFAIRKRHLVEETCRDLRNKRSKLET